MFYFLLGNPQRHMHAAKCPQARNQGQRSTLTTILALFTNLWSPKQCLQEPTSTPKGQLNGSLRPLPRHSAGGCACWGGLLPGNDGVYPMNVLAECFEGDWKGLGQARHLF